MPFVIGQALYMARNALQVEVAYANASQQAVLTTSVPIGATLVQAIQLSGILVQFPEIDLNRNPVGIFAIRKDLQTLLKPGDRIEIYRPLQIDPKQARMTRGAKKFKKVSLPRQPSF
jgi:putative ubiquitin-RnfH superfamily antitoxin RatB of RatAB toxin-antitoxin module